MKSSHQLSIAVALALGLVACGKKEEAPKPSAAPAAPAGTVVTIAHAGPLTGSIAHLGKDDENGVALAVAQANDKKITIGGQPVTFKMQSEDDQADPKVGTTVAQKLVAAKAPDVVFHGGMDATGGPMLKQARELGIKSVFAFGDGACPNEMAKLAGAAAEGMACSQAGLPAEASSKDFRDAFNAKYGEIKQYAPYFFDGTNAIIEAMKKANSTDPGKFTPEMVNGSFTGATGKVEFHGKGDAKDAEMTIFRMKDGKIQPVAIVKGGVSTPFSSAAAAPAAPAAPAPGEAKPAEPKKEEAKK